MRLFWVSDRLLFCFFYFFSPGQLNFTCFAIPDGLNQCDRSTFSCLGGRFYTDSVEFFTLLSNKGKVLPTGANWPYEMFPIEQWKGQRMTSRRFLKLKVSLTLQVNGMYHSYMPLMHILAADSMEIAPVTVLRIMPACFHTSSMKTVGLHWELTSQKNKAAHSHWVRSVSCAPDIQSNTSLILFVPLLPPCARHTSAKRTFPWTRWDSNLELRGQFGGNYVAWNYRSLPYILPPALLFKLNALSVSIRKLLPKMLLRVSQLWLDRVGKQLHNSSLILQESFFKSHVTGRTPEERRPLPRPIPSKL